MESALPTFSHKNVRNPHQKAFPGSSYSYDDLIAWGKGFEMRSASKFVAIGFSVALLIVVLVITLPQAASADSVMWTSDTDWLSGTMDSNVVLKGTGPAAWLELRKGDFPDWMKMSASSVPNRDGACLVWVDTDNSFILYGGYGLTGGYLGDTWKYNFTNDQWTDITPATSPPARWKAGCTYDPVDRFVLMFGGFDGLVWSSQTWKFDPATTAWTQLFPTGAAPRNLQATPVTYDYQHRKFIMVGGNTVTNVLETWAYDVVANSWTLRTTSGPSVRDGHNIAYNNATDRTFLFSGGSISMPVLYCDFYDYAYSSNTWSKWRDCIPNEDPNARVGHGMVYRDSYAGVLMFGGKDITAYPPETWVWLASVSDWYLPPITSTPGGRTNIQLANDRVDDASLLFGGLGATGGVKNDTWALAKGYVVNVDAVWTSSSTPVDTGCTNPVYNNIYWNSTTTPLGTILRFQIATSNSPTGPWTFTGPGMFPGSHYTTWGQQIDAGNNGREYFRMDAKLKTVNGRVTPRLEDLEVTWTCPPTAPFIKDTNPASGQTNVPINAPIWVNFSEPMNRATVTWTISGGITANPSWSNGNRTLELIPTTAFRDCTIYTAQITGGKDVNDNLDLVAGPAPNPWSFTTICINPYIVSTDPANDAFDVPITKSIVVTFNEPMNTATVAWTISGGIALSGNWNANRDVLTLSHALPFVVCTVYTAEITGGQDDQGLPLVAGPVPNPWSFFSFCTNPVIVQTNPADRATNVPLNADIVVTFSHAMNIGTVQYIVGPPLTGVTNNWNSPANTVLTISHSTAFAELATYTVNVTQGLDTAGNLLIPGPKPNPWSFQTIGINPYITQTVPASTATGIALTDNVVVTFSEAMNIGTVSWTISGGITLSGSWNSPTNTVLTLTHATPFVQCTQYTAEIIAGQDTVGLPLVGGPVPNPWSFRTFCPLGAPRALTLTELPPNNILLTWAAVSGATAYKVYASSNRFAAFPSAWTLLTTTTLTQYTATGHLSDGQSHFYVVRPTDGFQDGPNSTMGVKISLSFGYSTVNTNIAWFSLPYVTNYRRASDIASRLGPANADVIGKWDPATQSSVVYYFARAQWRGTNFPINPGDGLFLGVRRAFTWNITGVDAAPTLTFTANSPPRGNVNWISLPYTGIYNRASAIANELTSAKIVEVGLWDPTTQTATRWYYTGTWTGTDFTINPGAGVYVIIATSFTWTPTLVTPAQP